MFVSTIVKTIYEVFWYPQAIHISSDERNERLVASFIAMIMLSIMTAAMLSTIFTVIRLAGWSPQNEFWVVGNAAAMGMITSGLVFVFCWFRGSNSWIHLLSLTTSVVATCTYDMYFRFLIFQPANAIQMILGATMIGASLGIFYSVISAYVNYGLPQIRQALSYSFLGAILILIVLFAVTIDNTAFPFRVSDAPIIILACIMGMVGFFVFTQRIEDWVIGYFRFLLKDHHDHWPIPHVTPLPIPLIQNPLRNALNQDWEIGLYTAKDLWENSRQRHVVVHALYDYLLLLDDDERILGIRDIQIYSATDLMWLIHGNKANYIRAQYKTDASVSDFRFATEETKIDYTKSQPEFNKFMGKVTKTYSMNKHSVENRLNLELARSEQFRRYPGEADKGSVGLPRNIERTIRSTSNLESALQILDGVTDDLFDRHLLQIPKMPKNQSHRPAEVVVRAIIELHDIFQLISLYKHCHSDRRSRIVEVAINSLSKLSDLEMVESIHIIHSENIDKIVQGWKQKIEEINSQEMHNGFGTAVIHIWLPPCEENPYTYDEPLRQDSENFVSRRQALRTMKKCWDGDHVQSINITGSVLSGKTSLLLAAADSHLGRDQLAYLSLEHLNMDGQGIVKIAFALCDLLTELMPQQEIDNTRIQYEPYRVLESLIRRICRINKELGRSFILALDDFDYIEQIIETSVFGRFLRFLHFHAENIANFGLVIVGNVEGGTLYQQVKAMSSRLTASISIASIPSGDLGALLSLKCVKFPYKFDAEAINYIYTLTNGNPYLIQVIAWHVLDRYSRGYNRRNRQKREKNTLDVDPYFMKPDISAAIADPLCRESMKYYFYRLLEYFDDVADIVDDILCQFSLKSTPVLTVEDAMDIVTRYSDRDIPDASLIESTLDRLVIHEVLDIEGDCYSLQMKIIHDAPSVVKNLSSNIWVTGNRKWKFASS